MEYQVPPHDGYPVEDVYTREAAKHIYPVGITQPQQHVYPIELLSCTLHEVTLLCGPMNITLLAKKGGVGKSTLSLLLHEAFRQAGKTVSLHDWDAQGTSNKALELIFAGNAPTLSKTVDIVIYDTPPDLTHIATATAVRDADLVLVITSPSPADIWEADEAVRFVRKKNPSAKVRVIFNKVRKATVLGRLVEESAKQLSVPVLPVTLSARECYQHAVAQGWKALDSAARQEVLRLIVALFEAQ